MGETYASAGVSIEAGEEAVRRIAPLARSTFRPEVLGDIGAFGSLVAVPAGYREPVLVSSTDGVGTKLFVAEATGRFDTIGIDLVAMCVDDVAVQGADPLFFLDYVAVDRVEPALIEALVSGMADGCRQAGCALVGGEVAEHGAGSRARGGRLRGRSRRAGRGPRRLDRDGRRRAARPAVARAALERVLAGPAGAARTGRPVARRRGVAREPSHTLADELLRPSVVYAPALAALRRAVPVHAFAHITGGGLPGNLPRVLPEGRAAVRTTELLAAAADLRRDPAAGRGGGRRDGPGVQPRHRDGGHRRRGRRRSTAQEALADRGGSYVIGSVVVGPEPFGLV